MNLNENTIFWLPYWTAQISRVGENGSNVVSEGEPSAFLNESTADASCRGGSLLC